MKWIALASLLAVTACSGIISESRHTVATASYDPQKRDEVWARALWEFQRRGVLVAVSDRSGGVLSSQQQPTRGPCSNPNAAVCSETVSQQLTLTAGGFAALRTNRGLTASWSGSPESAFVPGYDRQFQYETTDLLTAITGTPATAFNPSPVAPPAPKASAKPTKPQPAPGSCEASADCVNGGICFDGFCRR